ncbi:MAG: glutaminase [Muribaculaceae bacterium]|nr:glutaminase [Muribaculaceae bacterium]
MDRKISIADLQKAVDEAYEKYKDLTEGNVDSRSGEVAVEDFGISITLTDGRKIEKGQVNVPSPMGSIYKVPVLRLFLSQNNPDEIHAKMGGCKCGAGKSNKPKIAVSPKGARLVSTIEPQNDEDGKMDIITSAMVDMVGSEPVFDDTLYRSLKDELDEEQAVNLLAQADWTMYDDSEQSLDATAKLTSMRFTASQLSAMGATIAADGYNPVTKGNAFDGELSKRLTAFMAAKGPHKMAKPWLMCTGLPAVSSFGGTIMGTLPGVFGIATYSPLVGCHGVSKRGAKAISYIMNKLDLSALSSSRVEIVD